jgi:hypothetical protein
LLKNPLSLAGSIFFTEDRYEAVDLIKQGNPHAIRFVGAKAFDLLHEKHLSHHFQLERVGCFRGGPGGFRRRPSHHPQLGDKKQTGQFLQTPRFFFTFLPCRRKSNRTSTE